MVVLSEVFRDAVRIEPAPYGLLSPAVNVIEDRDAHWQGGFSHRVSSYTTLANSAADGTARVEIFTPENPSMYRDYVPFLVEVTLKASTIGNRPDEIKLAVRQHLEAATQKAIEREFWAGEVTTAAGTGNRFLAENPEVIAPASGAPVKSKYALALLERALGDFGVGERGVIHVTRDVGSALGIKGQDGVIETPMGNYVVAGTGYTGTGPTAPTGNQSWAYATGPVTVRLGPTDFYQEQAQEAVDVGRNVIEYKAVRSAAVTWLNDAHYGILIDLALDFE